MTDQIETPQAHTFTEAPASWNVKYSIGGFECMLTLRANSGKELIPQTREVIKWLVDQEATPGRPQNNGHAPAAPQQPATPPQPGAPVPATASAGQQPAEEHSYEVIQVNTVAHVVSEKGHHSLKVKGGRFSKFGVTAWSEVIPAQGWETWQIGQEFAPPAGMEYATVQDGKKVTQFRATQA